MLSGCLQVAGTDNEAQLVTALWSYRHSPYFMPEVIGRLKVLVESSVDEDHILLDRPLAVVDVRVVSLYQKHHLIMTLNVVL